MKAIQVEHKYVSNDILKNCEEKNQTTPHSTAPVCVLYAGTFITAMKYSFSISTASKRATLPQWLHKSLTNKPRKGRWPHAAPPHPFPSGKLLGSRPYFKHRVLVHTSTAKSPTATNQTRIYRTRLLLIPD